jgi:chemotaxis protein MotB
MTSGLLRPSDSDVQVWPAYTDVAFNITLILMVYLFTQAVVASQTSAILIEVQARQTALQEAIFQALPPEMRQDVTIQPDGNLLKITFADRILFETGRAELREEGEQVLGHVGGVLAQYISSFTRIQVEGHTDDIPIRRPPFLSNWELSSARATSVVRFMQDRVGMDPGLLSATGFSEYQPVDSNPTDQGRAKNRRIELVIVYSTLARADM